MVKDNYFICKINFVLVIYMVNPTPSTPTELRKELISRELMLLNNNIISYKRFPPNANNGLLRVTLNSPKLVIPLAYGPLGLKQKNSTDEQQTQLYKSYKTKFTKARRMNKVLINIMFPQVVPNSTNYIIDIYDGVCGCPTDGLQVLIPECW
jgi:uncharacterized membrane protein